METLCYNTADSTSALGTRTLHTWSYLSVVSLNPSIDYISLTSIARLYKEVKPIKYSECNERIDNAPTDNL
jgi:hypothetical protein